MGSTYLYAEAGISNAVIHNQAAYVAGWLKKLRDDRRLVIHAASQAQRAADYVLGKIPTEVGNLSIDRLFAERCSSSNN